MIDRSYLTDGRPYLNARQAAEYVGYEPGTLKAFYEWTYRHGVRQLPGRSVYARSDLDAAVRGQQPVSDEQERLRAMARADLKRGPRTVGRRRAS